MAHDWQADFEQLVDQHQSMTAGWRKKSRRMFFLNLIATWAGLKTPTTPASGCGVWR